MINEKSVALNIAAQLDYLLKTQNIKIQDVAEKLDCTRQSLSRNRNLLKKGKLPHLVFLIQLCNFFDYNFFIFFDNNTR